MWKRKGLMSKGRARAKGRGLGLQRTEFRSGHRQGPAHTGLSEEFGLYLLNCSGDPTGVYMSFLEEGRLDRGGGKPRKWHHGYERRERG